MVTWSQFWIHRRPWAGEGQLRIAAPRRAVQTLADVRTGPELDPVAGVVKSPPAQGSGSAAILGRRRPPVGPLSSPPAWIGSWLRLTVATEGCRIPAPAPRAVRHGRIPPGAMGLSDLRAKPGTASGRRLIVFRSLFPLQGFSYLMVKFIMILPNCAHNYALQSGCE